MTTPSNDTPVSGAVTLSNSGFLTIASVDIPTRPVAAGVLLETWGSILVEADYRAIVLSDSNGRRAFPVDRDPPEFNRDADYASALSERELRRFGDSPSSGKREAAGSLSQRAGTSAAAASSREPYMTNRSALPDNSKRRRTGPGPQMTASVRSSRPSRPRALSST